MNYDVLKQQCDHNKPENFLVIRKRDVSGDVSLFWRPFDQETCDRLTAAEEAGIDLAIYGSAKTLEDAKRIIENAFVLHHYPGR
jgi:hypothetical protein